MQCANSHQTLSVYLDGELPEKEKRRVEEHLNVCSSCREVLERMRVLWELIDAPVPKSNPYLATKVLARLNAETRSTAASWFGRLWIPAATVAVMVLGFFFGSMVESNGNGASAAVAEETVASVYADQFADFPEASLGQLYSEIVNED